MPAMGITGQTLPNRITSKIPVQNTGMASPVSEKIVTTALEKLLGLSDANTPSKVPTTMATSKAVSTSKMVGPMRSAIKLLTGLL